MIDQARHILAGSQRLFVLTGAGISAESGVPTFRGAGGLRSWRGIPFEQLSSAEMVASDLQLVWEWFDYRRTLLENCQPNPGHLALAAAQASGAYSSFHLVTQNIDDLHSQAGSENIIELHGNVYRAVCRGCGQNTDIRDIRVEQRPPVCSICADFMRPDVVLFGEMLNVESLDRAIGAAENSDVALVVGTSALVAPASYLPSLAAAAGATVIEINNEDTVLTAAADISLRGSSSELLPQLLK